MALAGGSVPGMSFEAFLVQAAEYENEDDLSRQHPLRSELNLTHPVAVRRVKELMEWVQSGAYDRIRDGDYVRRGEEPPPSAEYDDAVAHYAERFARILDRVAGGVQELGRKLVDSSSASGRPRRASPPRTRTRTSSRRARPDLLREVGADLHFRRPGPPPAPPM